MTLEYGTDSLKTTREDVTKNGFEATPKGEEWRASIIKELIAIRDGTLATNGWTSKEIEETLFQLCTT